MGRPQQAPTLPNLLTVRSAWSDRWLRGVALLALLASAAALGVAPAAIDASYSPIEHSVSESASQGTVGAWVARTGFLLFGGGVLVVRHLAADRWVTVARFLHLVFASCQFAVAAYAARSWMPGAATDAVEDLLHSVAATVMGFAFSFGVVAVSLTRGPVRWGQRLLDAVAVLAAVAIPLAMVALPDVDGALQRVTFAIAFGWYGAEAVRSSSRR